MERWREDGASDKGKEEKGDSRDCLGEKLGEIKRTREASGPKVGGHRRLKGVRGREAKGLPKGQGVGSKSATSQHSCSDLQGTTDMLALHVVPCASGEHHVKNNSLFLPLFQARNGATELIVSGGLNSSTQ